MNESNSLVAALTAHLALCQQALGLAQEENAAVADRLAPQAAQGNATKKQLISNLGHSLDRLRKARCDRQSAGQMSTSPDATAGALIRANQDLMLRVLVLSRETERLFLERGWFAPRDLPSAQSRRPNFVANLYRRHAPGTDSTRTRQRGLDG
jgi:hypothetical protein